MFKKQVTLLFLLLFASKNFSQNTEFKEMVSEKLNTYFELDRENIHLHLNKDVYLTDENIWFKGYVYNRKELTPFLNTTNVFVALYNESGIEIAKQLAYSNTGTFEGTFNNLNALPSGNYYIQVYTNWMNNFQENESSVYPITVINNANPSYFDTSKIDFGSAKIEINPEGGNLIYGVPNVIGVKITDKFNNPIGDLNAELKNDKGEIITEVAINKKGLGRFLLIPNNNFYSITAQANGVVTEQKIPAATVKGLALEVNNYVVEDKASVKIKTNAITYDEIKAKKLFLVVHQDARAVIFDVNLDPNSLEQNIVFSTETLSEGVNFVRIVDENMNQLAERVISKLPNSSGAMSVLNKTTNNGETTINLKSAINNLHLSASVLPVNSNKKSKSNSIQTTFLYNSYLTQPLVDLEYYTSEPSIAKKYEIDLVMLNEQNTKYKWNQIVNNPPTAKYEFEMGLTLKGKLNTPVLKDKEAHSIRLRSFHHFISMESPISNTSDFEFKNLILSDSTMIDFGLFKKGSSEPLKITYSARTTNGNQSFKDPFKGFAESDLKQSPNTTVENLPQFSSEAIALSEVEIKKMENRLKRADDLKNAYLRGYKVPETAVIPVLTHISLNGFRVGDNNSEVTIIAKNAEYGGSPNPPAIFLDDIKITDFTYFRNMTMNELDEIYINPYMLPQSSRDGLGMIRMYRTTIKAQPTKTNLKYYTLNNGFARTPKFTNSKYLSITDPGFAQYGVLNWLPSVLSNENNEFEINTTTLNQEKAKVTIEGFSYDGKLVSEVHYIDL